MEIRKKIWPEYFKLLRSKRRNCEVRLADFECKEGDVLMLEEYDPKTKKYTGRTLRKKIIRLSRLDLLKFYNLKDLQEKGIYIMELE